MYFDSTFTTVLSGLTFVACIMVFGFWRGRKSWDPSGQYCYVTGGSSGLGLSLAIILAQRGADVTIVARNEERLQMALEKLEEVRQSSDQKLNAFSHSLNDAAGAEAALNDAVKAHDGRCPDVLFLCAGNARPGFFIEQDEAALKWGMDSAYWVQAFSALAGGKRMASTNTRGKIVFVSSVLGFMSIIGYSSYSPGKHALRGLAETLRQELILYGISVHIFFPATIFTPGYEEENKTKPKITLKLEENDPGNTAKECADSLLAGVENGQFHISIGFLSNVFRATARGASPYNNVLMDTIYSIVGWIALPVWRRGVDSSVITHREEHQDYLRDHGTLILQ